MRHSESKKEKYKISCPLLSKNDTFIRESVAVTYLFISIVAILYRDNADIKRVRTKNGGCEKNLKSHFYISIIFSLENLQKS